jgi:hypothetical protein
MAQPVHEIRMALIKARVWQKRTRSGQRHTVSVVRLYRDGDVWKESSRFGRDDLPVVRLVLDHAHTWVFQNTQAQQSSRPGSNRHCRTRRKLT